MVACEWVGWRAANSLSIPQLSRPVKALAEKARKRHELPHVHRPLHFTSLTCDLTYLYLLTSLTAYCIWIDQTLEM